MKSSRGFTLIEILVAVTIVAILAIAGLVSFSKASQSSRDAKRKADVEQIRSALEMYRADNGFYPAINTASPGTASNLSGSLVPTYIPAIPTDPKSANVYQFQATVASGGNYYGYCIYAQLEGTAALNATCASPPAGTPTYNYSVKNP